MARFKAPKNFGGFTHRGESFKAKKGVVDLPDDLSLELAAAHGLMLADAQDGEEQDDSTAPAGGEGAGA